MTPKERELRRMRLYCVLVGVGVLVSVIAMIGALA